MTRTDLLKEVLSYLFWKGEGELYRYLQDRHFRLGEQPVQRPKAKVGLEFSGTKKAARSLTVDLPTLLTLSNKQNRRF